MRIGSGVPSTADLVQGARETAAASLRQLRDSILSDINRQRSAAGLSPFTLDAAQAGSDPSSKKSDDAVQSLEARISGARIAPHRKDMLRRFAAASMKELKDAKATSKLFRSVLAMVDAWEFFERDKAPANESGNVKRIADYLADFDRVERAAGEIAAAYDKAKPTETAPAAQPASSSTVGTVVKLRA